MRLGSRPESAQSNNIAERNIPVTTMTAVPVLEPARPMLQCNRRTLKVVFLSLKLRS